MFKCKDMRATTDLSLSDARRLALAGQGFDRPRPADVSARDRRLRATLRRLGVLQLDFVNVLVPAHYLIPFSRVGPYRRPALDDLVYRRREFTEQWAHEAAIMPVEHWPLLRHRMATCRLRPRGFEAFLERHADYSARVLDEVRARGPLSADDLPPPDGHGRRLDQAWFGTIPRAVLEAHFARGTLAVAGRLPSMARSFDLAERVIGVEHYGRTHSLRSGRALTREEAERDLLMLAARAHGVGTAADLADYYRMPPRDARAALASLVADGELRIARVEGWREPAYLHPAARAPEPIRAAALLSPFDPVVWCRDRAKRLFDFDYRIEIYTPAARRRWGYYVLPFLLGDRLAARVDLKADRQAKRLLVLSSHLEAGVRADEVAPALAAELRTLGAWLGLDDVVVGRKGGLSGGLRAAVRA